LPGIIATLGFDERHVIRSMLRIGFGGVQKIVLLVPRGGLEERAKRALDEISKLAGLAGVKDISTAEVPIEVFHEAVATIRRIVRDCVRSFGGAVVSLGGGMRALVIETLLAVLTLPIQDKKSVKIVVDLETSQGSIEFPASIPIDIRLSEVEIRALEYVINKGRATLGEVSEDLKLARSTAWKALEKLVSIGCLKKEDFTYIPTDIGLFVNAIIKSSA